MRNRQNLPERQTILELLKWASSHFKSQHIENPRASAEILLSHLLNMERIDLYLRHDQPLSADEVRRFDALVQRRLRREPVAYIIGEKNFWSLNLRVTGDVLIPRPETECLVERALEIMSARKAAGPCCVLDLGAGSGAIILALASERPMERFFASDASMAALSVAEDNARRHNLDALVTFLCGRWFEPFRPFEQFDMIVSNPPYIPTRIIQTLAPEIFQYEPAGALDGGPDGLDAVSIIISQAHRYMAPGGVLLMEIGWDQRKAVEDLALRSGQYEGIRFIKDYSGHDRILEMVKTASAGDFEKILADRKSICYKKQI